MSGWTPAWLRLMERADSLEREAAELRASADRDRCSRTESGGERCTFNAGHVGKCQVRHEWNRHDH